MELRVSARRPYRSDRDDDDDDRNHKHHRRNDAMFQSLDNDVTKPYRRGSKHYQNGSQSNETWRKYSFNPLEKNISVKFDQKGPRSTQISRFHGPLGLQGTYRAGISLNTGLVRKQCRDFEEQGFCLRGDMCPMEHGMNRIVVEDVQSLSQFNLPISLATANLSTPPVGPGPTPSTSVVTNTLSNSKSPHNSDINSPADFYDPDQPLLTNDPNTPTRTQNDPLLDNSLSTSIKKRTKPSQKAHRTLFVNCIPQQENKRENLLSHFKKFGEVTNISIPVDSKLAFVQFSKREEAEAALMSPDAVMSNRFIKLFWANRDIVHDSQTVGGNNVSKSPYVLKVLASGHPKVTAPLQKKLESLELLKEELRKKQEMLDRKRNDFRLKLDKLAKQATCPKSEVAPEHLAKKQKLGVLADSVKAVVPSVQDEAAVAVTSSKSVGPSGKQSSKTNLALALPESLSLKASSLSSVNLGSPVGNNPFKLDNRPTAFKVVPPLPDGLADVSVLKEHFSPYGDLSSVQVDNPKTSNVTAQIHFRTRHEAEKAFLGGKTWKGHSLQFVWLNSSNSRKDDVPFIKDSPKNITSQQACTSGDGDCEETEGTENRKDDMVQFAMHQSNCISGSE